VKNGATLTIEAGATVNIPQSASLQIEGTLTAKGTPTDNIVLNGGGNLMFMTSSTSWNQQSSSGSIIENAAINYVSITILSSPKINNNTIYKCFTSLNGGSPLITSNTIFGSINSNESSQSPVISNNNIEGSIIIYGGSPIITQNLIRGISIDGQSTCSSIVLVATYGPRNRLYNAVITDNTIMDGLDGISSLAEGGTIMNNLITNCSRDALALGTMPETSLYAVVENNTLANSGTGIHIFNYNGVAPPPPVITQNNIENNSENVYSYCSMSIPAIHNWWGTTDELTIKQKIHDHAFESGVGVINVIPCLTEANPFAYPNPNNNSIPNPITIIPSNGNGNLTASTQPPQTNQNSTATPTPTPNTNYFAIESNSTVSALSFNATSSEISFTVNGTTGTTGYVKATISKAFMPNGENIKVYLDGNPVNYTETSNQEDWIITFIYHHSIHQVKINQEPNPAGTTMPTEDKNLVYVAAGIIAALIAFLGLIIWVALGKKHSPKNKETRNLD
jgi:hypothetical protein